MRLIEYTAKYKDYLDNYYLADDTFSRSPQESLLQTQRGKEFHRILAFNQDDLVTFFILDEGKDKYDYIDRADSLLLRSFSTDSRYTKKGFALQALKELPAFVQKKFPHIGTIVLGVNEENTKAIQLYKKSHFTDTGRKYKGRKGWQLIFELPIH
ncbi:GNAT family N-acetyltransferase [Tetragenococcus koreensis]|uniref:Acetyltransferase n=1 Tax=Tetragenococcus koreensis TaxID=290335 RepID=A0AAN4RKD5_9ENTE|nr:GNAT family protein [Tetragenococcus koreensis]MCF1585560.1 GNAT family N-acetyltransferase [Tetragenococcus koreensis]MCF1615106.1 GNAT family N-acetyltransferase [Tetragenococcus koreensis]MCF1620696.1 GNAT family N-acetyltransferase [Tetragenococcus koreensis]MCF1624934.1 GNAT family N-acetyltransferase [Tetragenococcus koreensis]MCF1626316.1 GNAT family N-acetyltransferase [Tetragenococcus koreensis]